MYLSLLGQDLDAGQTLTAHGRFSVAESISDSEIVERYMQYLRQPPIRISPVQK